MSERQTAENDAPCECPCHNPGVVTTQRFSPCCRVIPPAEGDGGES